MDARVAFLQEELAFVMNRKWKVERDIYWFVSLKVMLNAY